MDIKNRIRKSQSRSHHGKEHSPMLNCQAKCDLGIHNSETSAKLSDPNTGGMHREFDPVYKILKPELRFGNITQK